MWLLLSLLSAVLETAKDVTGKLGSKSIDESVLALSLHVIPTLILLPLVLIEGIPEIAPAFWWSLVFFLVLAPTWSIYYVRALKQADISVVIPILVISNLITALIAPLFGAAWPSLFGWVGLSFLTVGLYLTRFKNWRNLMGPFTSMLYDTGSRSMLVVALIWSVIAHLSKINVEASSPIMSSFSVTLISVIGLGLMAKKTVRVDNLRKAEVIKYVILLGLFSAAVKVLVSYAFDSGYAPYVVAVKRTSIFWSFWAGIFFFKEQANRLNWIGSIITVLGVGMVAFA